MSDHDKQKQIWLWSAVSIIMIAVVFFWFTSLPKQLKVQAASNLEKELFSNSTDEISNLLAEQKAQSENIKQILITEIKNLSASSTTSTIPNKFVTSTLTAKQIQELKNKLEKK